MVTRLETETGDYGVDQGVVVDYSFWPWLLQRVTASGCRAAADAHRHRPPGQHLEVEKGILPGLVVFSDVAERLESPAYWVIDLLLLSFALYHGLNGVRNVLLDYGLRGVGERVVTAGLSLLGVAAFAYGVIALAAFID